MKPPCRLRDTIAWRFGAIITAAIVVTGVLTGLFYMFGGRWTQPPMDLRSLLAGVTAVVDIIEAAPPEIRPRLVATPVAHGNEYYRMEWYGADSGAARWFDAARQTQHLPKRVEIFQGLNTELHRPYVMIGPEKPLRAGSGFPFGPQKPDAYYLIVKLRDGSWLVFLGGGHKWGLSSGERIAILLAVFLVVAGSISAVATRQISRPIRKFAVAVHAAGVNPNAPPIPESGPHELREVIAAFNGMQAKISAFVAYRTAMLAAISHDLRTPLTRIRLRGEYIADPVQRERLIADALEMQEMVDGALAFFRGDSEEEPVRSFDLSGLLQSIVDGFADQGVEVAYSGPDHVVYTGRALAIKRAVTNLVENAVKYASAPAITLEREATAVTITVRDRGQGIPEAALESVFEPFFRLDKSRHKARGGVGLGLTAARSILRGHGGDLVLRNLAEGGLEACATLPGR
ncbi:two-component system osmolarity sensor histidine kinase EnvZ [Rhizomicrobium palustre]|uniref:histidine kinase n=1 Tax=Rhizomicrobium palustre TaxID=189966 RepID=A0A846MWZ9_9PROT|nr:ATP-binding protein [Rhizomicrobium palustre]NIK87671.1 two-component system osmolarity sensor histidine kinase EnvZ [Rhizomicrobium palustre]